MSADPRGALGTAVTARARFGDLAEQVALVEGLGYTSVWLPEISGRDALVTLGALAGRTERIRLATGLVPLPSRPLAALTMAAAAVAELAPGRFTLGLGAGHRETAAHYGWARPARVSELEQAVVAIRRALRDGHLSGVGPAGPVDLALQGVHVEVLPEFVVGALRPRMAGMAGRVADGILLNWVTVERARTVVSAARAAAAEVAGTAEAAGMAEAAEAAGAAEAAAGRRPLRVSCYVPVCVTEDPVEQQEARAVVAHQLSSYTRLRAYGDLLVEDGYADEVAAVRAAPAEQTTVSRRLVDAVALIGDTATVQEGLDAYRQVGVDEPVLAPLAVGTDPGASLAATWAALAD